MIGALGCSLITLLLAGAGGGPKYMESVIQDDAQFLHRPAAQVRESMERVATLGVDRVRITASWATLAPHPRAKKVPAAPFDASDSKTYPRDAFRTLDTAIKAADSRGLKVMIDLAFWAPRWAVGRAASNPARERYWVDAPAFADFATAVARRYSGGFADPANPASKLPVVRIYTTWNEPNHPSFLAPQWIRDGSGGYRPESPHIYRALHNAAYTAIKRIHSANDVLVGGTASSGSTVPGKGGVPPLQFVRALACVDDKLEPLRVPECDNFTPLRADGYAHHPYSRYVTPGTSSPVLDDAPIADVERLGTLLDRLFRQRRIANRLSIFNTEYGYESSQDDPFQPFTRDQQARFMGWATYLAWKDPYTRSFAQFLLRDIDPRESGKKKGTRSYYRDWQTGLYDAKGQPKPALQGFKLPFWAQTHGLGNQRYTLLFGQVRPGRGARTVQVQRQNAGGGWGAISTYGPSCDQDPLTFQTDKAGFFLRSAAALGAGMYRMGWRHDDGTWEYSVAMPVSDDGAVVPPL